LPLEKTARPSLRNRGWAWLPQAEIEGGNDMPIYEYRCEDCGKISEFLLIKTDETFARQCKRCKSKKMTRVLSRVRVIRSEESRIESLADPSKWGGLDEKDPKSMAKWMKRMGKEMGEDMGEDVGQMVDEAMEEERASRSEEGLED
jgi:putative FmdB family regulatory protein